MAILKGMFTGVGTEVAARLQNLNGYTLSNVQPLLPMVAARLQNLNGCMRWVSFYAVRGR